MASKHLKTVQPHQSPRNANRGNNDTSIYSLTSLLKWKRLTLSSVNPNWGNKLLDIHCRNLNWYHFRNYCLAVLRLNRGINHGPAIPLLRCLPTKMHTHYHQKKCMKKNCMVMLKIHSWKLSKCPLIAQWTSILWYAAFIKWNTTPKWENKAGLVYCF